MLHHEDGRPLGSDGLEGLKNILNDQRSQTQGGFIQQQNLRVRHQRPANGQHLLLTAGEGSRLLAPPLPQNGKQFLHSIHVFLILLGTFDAIGSGLEVFLHGQSGKDQPALRRHIHAHTGGFVSSLTQYLRLAQMNGAIRPYHTGDGPECGGLSCAVGSQQRHKGPLLHIQINSLYCLNGSVIDLEVSDFQQRHYFSTSSSLSPKYAFCTCGSF